MLSIKEHISIRLTDEKIILRFQRKFLLRLREPLSAQREI
jgi:hypothetical protein